MSDTLPIDTLTGAYSAEAYRRRLPQAIEKAQALEQEISLAMIDLDYFKSINDAFGHQRGNEALVGVVNFIKSCIRKGDEIFRYGGDEFMVLLPGSGKQQAVQIVERIQNTFKDTPIPGKPPVFVSASFGVVTFPEDSKSPEELFAVLDRRLFQGKSTRRGQIIYAEVEGSKDQFEFHIPDRIVERDEAIHSTHDFLQQLKRETAGILHIAGQPGSGRSRFLRQVVQMAQMLGYTTWTIPGSAPFAARRFGVLDPIRKNFQIRAPFSLPDDLAEAIRRHTNPAETQGLLLCVDDIDQIDSFSLDAIQFALGSKFNFPIGLIYTGRTLSQAFNHPQNLIATHVELQPLSELGVHIWLRYSLRWEPPLEFVHWLHRQTRGYPKNLLSGLFWLARQGLLRQQDYNWTITGTAELDDLMQHVKRAVRLKTNLPASLPLLIGREQEIWTLKDWLHHHPLITICGLNGLGKSRLALQVAAEMGCEDPGAFTAGIYRLGLDAEESPTDLLAHLSQTLGLAYSANEQDLLKKLEEFIGEKRLLMILEDYPTGQETSGSLAVIDRLIAQLPGLHVLVTALMPLGIPGEKVLTLSGLPVPESDAETEIRRKAASQLFLWVAGRQGTNPQIGQFQPKPEDWPWIRQICRLLDGAPLWIELCAAWVSSYTCEEITREIKGNQAHLFEEGSDLSAQRVQEYPAGHVIRSFWNLLSESEQTVLASLSIFKESFTQSAARQISGASPFFQDALIAKNILRILTPQRYSIHPLISGFADNQLASRPEVREQIRDRYTGFYLQRLIRAQTGLASGAVKPEALQPDLANFFKAWDQALQDRSAQLLCESVGPITNLLFNLGHFYEWIKLTERALQAIQSWQDPPPAADNLRAALLSSQGDLYYHTGLYQQGIRLLEEAIGLHHQLNQTREEANGYHLLANLYVVSGQYEQASRAIETGLKIARPLDDPPVLFSLFNRAGVVAFMFKNYAQARTNFEEAHQIALRAGDQSRVAVSLVNQGETAYITGDYENARRMLLQSLAICSQLGVTTLHGSVLNSLGKLATLAHQETEAARWFIQGLRLVQDIEAVPLAIEILKDTAVLWYQQEKYVYALALLEIILQQTLIPHNVRQEAADLRQKLLQQEIKGDFAPNWQPAQLRRVMIDVVRLLGE
jgi:diguanylate cyclase (GGDEF)-like protein